jgi:hypothetical protein
MFVRKKKNKSGKISVQVIDKSLGKYTVLHTVGSSADLKIIEQYVDLGYRWIKEHQGLQELDFTNDKEHFERLADSITHLELAGVGLLLGKIFDDIGFNTIEDDIFRYLVYYRLVFPRSKLKTTEFLARYHNIYWSEDAVYRYMDKLYNKQKEKVQEISFQHTLKILGGELKLVFYDVTTIYFEIDAEDELRKTGYSKDGKAQHPQIVLGLLVSENGYPLAGRKPNCRLSSLRSPHLLADNRPQFFTFTTFEDSSDIQYRSDSIRPSLANQLAPLLYHSAYRRFYGSAANTIPGGAVLIVFHTVLVFLVVGN